MNVIGPGPIKTRGLVDLAGPDAAKQEGLLDYMASTVPADKPRSEQAAHNATGVYATVNSQGEML